MDRIIIYSDNQNPNFVSLYFVLMDSWQLPVTFLQTASINLTEVNKGSFQNQNPAKLGTLSQQREGGLIFGKLGPLF